MGIIREREWIKYLPDGFTIYFALKTLLSQIVSFSVVLIKDDQCIKCRDKQCRSEKRGQTTVPKRTDRDKRTQAGERAADDELRRISFAEPQLCIPTRKAEHE